MVSMTSPRLVVLFASLAGVLARASAQSYDPDSVSDTVCATSDTGTIGCDSSTMAEVGLVLGGGTNVTDCSTCNFDGLTGACYSIKTHYYFSDGDTALDGWRGNTDTYSWACWHLEETHAYYLALGTSIAVGVATAVFLGCVGIGLCCWCRHKKKNKPGATVVGSQPMQGAAI